MVPAVAAEGTRKSVPVVRPGWAPSVWMPCIDGV